MAVSRNRQLCATAQGQPLVTTSTDTPNDLQPHQVLIQLRAVAINPADSKMVQDGHRVTRWPFIPGLDGAGIVSAAGRDVKNFKVGDEVLAMFTPTSDTGGSYQNYAIASEMMVAPKPKQWSFAEAATLSVCYITAAIGLGFGLKTAMPWVKDGPTSGFQPSSILVLGGSSALGASTIQLLRISLPNSTIFATSSPKHHKHIEGVLGANKAFNRSSASLVEEIKAATPGGQGIDAIIDCVGAGATERHIFDVFDPSGAKKYAQVWTGDDEIEAPHGIDSTMFRGRDMPALPGHPNIMLGLQDLLEDGRYKLPVPVRHLGDQLDALVEGVELMGRGISGEKLVVTLPNC